VDAAVSAHERLERGRLGSGQGGRGRGIRT
jgi:hypothetical protein